MTLSDDAGEIVGVDNRSTFTLSLAFTYGIKGAVFPVQLDDENCKAGHGGSPRRIKLLESLRTNPSLVTMDTGGSFFGGTNAILFPSNQGSASAAFFGKTYEKQQTESFDCKQKRLRVLLILTHSPHPVTATPFVTKRGI